MTGRYPAPPSRTAARLFDRYIRGQVRRCFTGVHWAARGRPERWDRELPTLFLANHTNWWDGFLACLLTGRLGLRFQVLMEAQHLARYPIFLRVGALPMRRRRPREAYEDLTAAAAYLEPGVALWVFPQGERRPPREPLAGCERGAAHLALRAGRSIRVCPVAFRYAFVGEQLPDAFLLVGDEWLCEPGARTERGPLMTDMESRLAATVSALDGLLDQERLDDFRPLADGKLSVNKRLDRFRHAIGLLRGPFEARNG
ncbi:MAG: 1-acyl-sn-glycerol-3-phosphate acyltransferase [Gemmatimonadales bacterium]|nr:1-acyl-sn-glycerol-3-phosphate acyltransferase [Gemmatimonadales bacterium]